MGALLLLPVMLRKTTACPGLSAYHPSVPTRPMSVYLHFFIFRLAAAGETPFHLHAVVNAGTRNSSTKSALDLQKTGCA